MPSKNITDKNESDPWIISITRPNGYLHSEAFREAAEALKENFRSQGDTAIIEENTTSITTKTIILGAHLLEDFPDESNAYIYNLEKLPKFNFEENQTYKKILSKANVIDYCTQNINILGNMGIKARGMIRIWHCKKWERIHRPSKPTYHVLVIGSITERRAGLIKELEANGIKILTLFGRYGFERDLAIGSCELVLNIHAYENDDIFEIAQMGYLASNNIPFVSEISKLEENESEIKGLISWCDESNMVEIIKRKLGQNKAELLKNTAEICNAAKNLGIQKKEIFTDENSYTQKNDLLPQPSFINLGCGRVFDPEMLNIDSSENSLCDTLLNIENVESLPMKINSKRHGELYIEKNSIDLIIANEFLEHVGDLVKVMTIIKDLLKPGGMLKLTVPYDLSYGAWQDPTHRRAFNERSFWYYDQWCWYLGWNDYKLRTLSIELGNRENTFDNKNKNSAKNEGQEPLFKNQNMPRAITHIEALLIKDTLSIIKKPDEIIEIEAKIDSHRSLSNSTRRIYYKALQTHTMLMENNEQKKPQRGITLLQKQILPFVTLCTPTRNRQKFLPLAQQWILEQKYPKDKIEWLIVDDSDNNEPDFTPGGDLEGLKINYVKLEGPIKLGKKRNIVNTLAEGEILINIDDDDYYYPERISHAVDVLTEEISIQFAGSNLLLVYFLDDDSLWLSNPGKNICCAGSFAYKRSFIERTFYDNHSNNGEEIAFTSEYTEQFAELEENKTMICIAHDKNTWDKNTNKKMALAGIINKNLFQRLEWFDTCNKDLFNWRTAYRALNEGKDLTENKKENFWANRIVERLIR